MKLHISVAFDLPATAKCTIRHYGFYMDEPTEDAAKSYALALCQTHCKRKGSHTCDATNFRVESITEWIPKRRKCS